MDNLIILPRQRIIWRPFNENYSTDDNTPGGTLVKDGNWHTLDLSNPPNHSLESVPKNAKSVLLKIIATSFVVGTYFRIRRLGDLNGINEYRSPDTPLGGSTIVGKELWMNIEGADAQIEYLFSGTFLLAGIASRAWIIED